MQAHDFLSAKSDDALRGIITYASDRFLPVSAATRREIDAAADMARSILNARA